MVMQSTPLAGLGSVLLIVAVLAFVGGLALSNTDALNPNTSAATARALDTKTNLEGEKAKIDLSVYQTVQTAWAQAEQARILSAQLEEKARARQQREMTGLLQMVLILAGGCAMVVLSTTGAYFLVEAGLSHRAARASNRPVADHDRWSDPVWRHEQVRRARLAEQAERQSTNGHHALPLPGATVPTAATTGSSLSQRTNGSGPRPTSPTELPASTRTSGAHRP